jgi:hypothetical protein
VKVDEADDDELADYGDDDDDDEGAGGGAVIKRRGLKSRAAAPAASAGAWQHTLAHQQLSQPSVAPALMDRFLMSDSCCCIAWHPCDICIVMSQRQPSNSTH